MPAARRRAALLVALTAVLTALLGPVARSAGGQVDAAGNEAFTSLASCVTDSRRLLVLLLIDTSGSLRETDPSAERVVAARVALSGLEALSRSSGVAVEVQLAGFSVGYEPVGTWTQLTSSSLGDLHRAVDTFAQRRDGIDTDYFAALQGAHRQVTERSAQLTAGRPTPAACTAVLWFTDGQYDVVDRLSAESRQAGLTKDYAPELRLDRPGAGQELVSIGRERLCAGANPLIDELRAATTGLFFVALTARIDPSALDFLDALTTGSGGPVRCGRTGSDRTGARLDAANLGDLLAAFDRAASEIGRGVRDPGAGETRVCATDTCPQGRRTFDLDDTIRRFHLLAVFGQEGVAIEVAGPTGGTVLIEPGVSGSGLVGAVPLRWQWASPTAVTLDGDHPAADQGWDGEWGLTFVHPAGRADVVARTQLYLFSDLVPKLLAPATLETGQPADLRVAVVSEVDEQVAGRVGDATLEVEIADPAGGVTRLAPTGLLPDGTFTLRYDVPAAAEPGDRAVTLRLLTRTRRGVALAPAERSVRLPLRVVAYPSVALANDRLRGIAGDGTTIAEVMVRADPRSAACVWLAGGEATGPGGAGSFATTLSVASAVSRDGCVAIAAGDTRRLTVTVDPDSPASGTVEGTLRFAAVADLSPEPRETVLEYSFRMAGAGEVARRRAVLVGLLLACVLLAVLVWRSLLEWRRARGEGLTESFPRWAWTRSLGRGRRVARAGIGAFGVLWARAGRSSWGRTRGWRAAGGGAGRRGGHLDGRSRGTGRSGAEAAGLDGHDEWGIPAEDDGGPRDRLHISVLLDRSESMTPLVSHVVDGCNAFLAVHRAEPGPARLTLVQFDLQDPLEVLLDGVDLESAPDLTYSQFRPRGVTPLYDAIGALLDRTEAEARARVTAGLPAEDQLVVVLTDGRDNASSRYSAAAIAQRIRSLEAHGWTFVFLAANQDARAEGAALGIAAGSTSDFSATDTGVRRAWATISRATLAHRRKRSAERAADRLDFFRAVQGADPGRSRRKARR